MNIIFITAIKSERSDCYKWSIESWKRWCLKNQCELRVLDEHLFDVSEMKPNFFRYYCFELLDQYDQICLVDADTIIHPDCPNFFELTDHKFTVVHNDGDYDWIIRSIENYQFEFPDEFNFKFDIWKYFNSGFMVLNQKHKYIFDILLDFYWSMPEKIREVQKKYGVGTDQPLINLFVQRSQVDLTILPYQFNMQDLERKNILDDRLLFTTIPGIYHFNAVSGGLDQVNYWMKRTYDYFYNSPSNLSDAIINAWDKTRKIHG